MCRLKTVKAVFLLQLILTNFQHPSVKIVDQVMSQERAFIRINTLWDAHINTPFYFSFYGSTPETAVAGDIMFSGCLSICPSLSCEHNIPEGNLLTFGTNVHLILRMN